MAMNIRQIRAQRPDWDGLDDAAVVDVIRQVYHPDLSSEQIASQIGVKLEPAPAPERSWGEAFKDTGAALVGGVGGLVKSGGDLYGLATGDMDNMASRYGRDVQEYFDSAKSDALKAKMQRRKENIDAADSTLGKAWTAVRDTLTDPALAMDTVAQNAATLLPGMAAGRFVAAAQGARALSAASSVGPVGLAARQAIASKAATLGTRTAIGVGAAQQASDVSGDIYESMMKKPDAVFDASPEFQTLLERNGGDRDAAKREIATSIARASFLPAAGISVAANALPGASYLERALVGGAARKTVGEGVKYAIPKAIIKGAAGEGTQELAEEGGGKLAANIAAQRLDPAHDTWQDVGESAGMGFAGGALLGGAGGAFNARTAPSVEERGPLSRAANAVLATQPQVPPMAPPDTPIPDDPALVTPEPEGDLQAQIAALRDPASAKDTALITPNNDPSTLNLDGLIQVPTHRGLLVTTDPAKAEAAQAWSKDITEAEMAGLMAYGAPKAESDGTVVQAQDADGNVVHEEATTQQDAPSAAQRVADMAPDGGQVAVTDVAAVQQRRAERLNAETDMAGMLAPANPLMESVRARPEQAAEPGQTQGPFRTYEEADAFRREQNKRGATVQALPIEAPDGSFMLATKGSPEYPAAERMRADRMKAKARADAGILDGDILNKLGEPFKGRLPARNAAKKAGEGFGVVEVKGGFVVRQGAQEAVADVKNVPAGKPAEAAKPEAAPDQAPAPAAGDAAATAPVPAAGAAGEVQAGGVTDARALGKEAGQRGDPRDPPEGMSNVEKQVWRAGWDDSKKIKVTPQIAGAQALRGFIGIAADSIDKLRAVDVDRVIGEAPAIYRVHLADHIRKNRPDLAQEVEQAIGVNLPAEQQASAESDAERLARIKATPPAERTDADLDWYVDYRQRARAQAAADSEKAEAAAKAAATSPSLDSYVKDMAPNVAALAIKALNKQIRIDGNAATLRQHIEAWHAAGELSVSTSQEPRIKPMSRTAFNRATQREQDAHERKMKEAGNKTVYWVNNIDLGKTAHDYAQHLLSKDGTAATDSDDTSEADAPLSSNPQTRFEQLRERSKAEMPEIEAFAKTAGATGEQAADIYNRWHSILGFHDLMKNGTGEQVAAKMAENLQKKPFANPDAYPGHPVPSQYDLKHAQKFSEQAEKSRQAFDRQLDTLELRARDAENFGADEQAVKDARAAVAAMRKTASDNMAKVQRILSDAEANEKAAEAEAEQAYRDSYEAVNARDLTIKPTPASINGWIVSSYKDAPAYTNGHIIDVGGTEPHLKDWAKRRDRLRSETPPSLIEKVMSNAIEKSTTKVELIGRKVSDDIKRQAHTIVFSVKDSQPALFLNENYARYFMSKYPGAEFFAGEQDKKGYYPPVIVKQKGGVVGVISPIGMATLDGKAEISGYMKASGKDVPPPPKTVPQRRAEVKAEEEAEKADRKAKAQERRTDAAPAFSRSRAQQRSLVTLHNLTAENLIHADQAGGLAVPSLGITKVDSPFAGFGNITLIGPRSMVDPEAGVPVFDRDGYTARFPDMHYKRPTAKKADALYERMAVVRNMGGDGDSFVSQLWDAMRNDRSPSPKKIAELFTSHAAPRLLYAKEVLGRTIREPMMAVPVREGIVKDKSLHKFLIANADALTDTTHERHQEARQQLAQELDGAINRSHDQVDDTAARDEVRQIDRDRLLGKDGVVGFDTADRLVADARRVGQKQVDQVAMDKAIDKAVPGNDPGYQAWVTKQMEGLFGEPTITLRGREVPATLDNIVQAMTIGGTAGAEKTLTSGTGKTAAQLGKRFRSIAEIQAARDQVVSEADENAAKKANDAILEEYRSKVIEHFTGTDWRGRIDTWAALDASMEALAVAGKRGNTTGASIRSALTAKGFRGFDMDVIELAKQSIDALRNTPTNYFEAKPQRAVKLNEFRGAVVPRGLSQQARDVLARSGIEVVEYGKGDGAREKAIAALSKRLDKAGGGDVMMSRGDDAASVSPSDHRRVQAVEQLVDGIKAQWQNAPDIEVVTNLQDPKVPQRVREYDAEQKSQGATGDPEGFFYKGKVYVVASQMATPQDVMRVLFHESLGHYGLRGVFGDALDGILKQMAYVRRGEVAKKAVEYGLVPDNLPADATPAQVLESMTHSQRMQAAEEVLAEMAQTRPELGFVKRAVAAIRTWLRNNVPGFKSLRVSDAEIIRDYILPARNWVERGESVGSMGGVMFSRAAAVPQVASTVSQAAQSISDGLKSITATNVKRVGKHKMTDWLGIGLQFLGRRQLVDIYGGVIPMDEYDRLAAQMEADKNDGGAVADELARRWGKLPDEAVLADLMHDATLAQIDADSDVGHIEGDDDAGSASLKDRFSKLSPEAQKVYREARDHYRAHHNEVKKAIIDRINRSELRSEKKAEIIKRMEGEFFQAVKGVYFPLARFGDYVVVVRGADNAVESVSRAETMAEADALRQQMVAAFPASKGYKVGRVMLSKEFVASRDMVGRGFMSELYDALDRQGMPAEQQMELEDTLGQLYLSSLPDLSWAKHGIHRKGTPGFSQDARRAFAQNTFHGARYLAKLRYADLMHDELTRMQQHVDDWSEVDDFDQPAAQRVVNEMSKRHDALMNPKSNPISTALTSFGFIYYLGLSPAAAVVNLSQTALVAYPIMGAKWGFRRSANALTKASEQTLRGRNDLRSQLTDADEIRAYDEAVRNGTIDVTQAHDLAGIAQGEDAKVMWKMRPVMRAASFMFHHAERFNRQATFIAAYRLARETGVAHKVAFEQAVKATYDSHYDYSAGNRPRVMQGNVARVVLLFKQFAQNMLYTVARNAYLSVKGESPAVRKEARKVFGALMVSHAAAAGVLGLPLVKPLLAIASAIGGDDDEPWDAEVALRNMLADAFGPKASEVMAKGLSRLTPWDISGRVGLDNLIFPDVREGLEGQRWAEAATTAMLGPVIGMGVNAAKASQQMADGNYLRGLEDLLPLATRNPIKAARYWSEGAMDKSGVAVKDEVGLAGTIGQAIGFSPSEVRLAFEGKSAIHDADRRLNERRSELLTRYARASMSKDSDGVKKAREAIMEFNQKNPGRRITVPQMRQSIRNRQRRIDRADQGVYLPKTRRDAMEAGRFALAD